MNTTTTRKDTMSSATTITVKDPYTLVPREYTITHRDGETAEQMPYLLTGKRGAGFLLIRERQDPTILHALPADLLRGSSQSAQRLGRFTDTDGNLRVLPKER